MLYEVRFSEDFLYFSMEYKFEKKNQPYGRY